MTSGNALGNAGYAITGSGGGGSGGSYVFASLAELDEIIAEWTAIRDAIYNDGEKLLQAQYVDPRPADDMMSGQQSASLIESINKAMLHNSSMFEYAKSYVTKFMSVREQYLADDEAATTRVRRLYET